MSSQTFLLGLGAQKCGTTWLYSYLSSSEGTDFGETKEYHIWDALEPGHDEAREHYFIEGGPGLRERFDLLRRRVRGLPRPKAAIRRELQASPDAYFDYFARLAKRSDARLTGDITPGYASLSVETLVRIRDGIASRGVDTRVVYLMRDPVERCISAARHLQRAGLCPDGHDLRAMPRDEAVRVYARTGHSSDRSRYDLTLQRIDEVFSPKVTYIGFYETMFSAECVAALSSFCDVPVRMELVDQKVNAAPDQAKIAPELREELRAHFANVYDYCNERFVETKEIWS